MDDDTSPADPSPEDDDEAVDVSKRDVDISKRAGVGRQLTELFQEVEQGFQDQSTRADDIQDYWDVYNCTLNGHQFYNGNSQIYVPIVHNAVNARKTRFANQIFPTNGRNVDVTSEDGTMPYAEMSLAEYYIRRSELRTKVMPSLLRSGDIEGQYTVYVEWVERKRNVTWKTFEAPELEDGGANPAAEQIETIKEAEIKDCFPVTEVIADADLLILPATANSIPDAIADGGSVTIIRRWSKSKIQQMIREGVIRSDAGEALIGQMTDRVPAGQKNKLHLEAAGIHNDGGTKFALIYQTWSILKVKGKRVICECFYGGDKSGALGARRNPLWSDRVPVLSVPVEKVAGTAKGVSKVKPVADIQYFANDAINEAADSAAYALLPIVMTDPAKNPRIGSMVLSLAAVWETSPQDTQFAQFPQLWQHGFEMVAAAKAEVSQTLSVSPAAITQGGAESSKPTPAEIAQEQQIDILTTADAVTVVEEGILTPWLELVIEMDHQYRDEDLTVQQFGRMGLQAQMEAVPPISFDKKFQFKWFGVEQARAAQQIQQQIAGMNVIRGIPPEQLNGYQVNLVPIVTQLVENTFGPRLAPLIFLSPADQLPVPPDSENQLLLAGYEVPTHQQDDDQHHIQVHGQILHTMEGKAAPNAKKTLAHIWEHTQQMLKKQQAQVAPPQGAPGVPGGAVGPQPQPGVAGSPRIGAQPGQATGGQGPPGMIHQDQLKDPAAMPRVRV
jgi:hypothetical protein